MLPIEQRNQVDKIWNSFRPVSSFKPLAVIELISYLLFIKRLDEVQELKENHPLLVGEPIVNPIYTSENQNLRWSRFHSLEPQDLYQLFTKPGGVFEISKTLTPSGTYAHLLKDMDVMFPTSGMLAELVQFISTIQFKDQQHTADLFNYLLDKIGVHNDHSQYPTPLHLTKLIVALMAPTPADLICDPAVGSGRYLTESANYLKASYPDAFLHGEFNSYFPANMFTGIDNDPVMIRIAAMHLLIHGIEDPKLLPINALGGANVNFIEKFSLIFATPPLTGAADLNEGDAPMLREIKSRKASLRYLALINMGLKEGGRAAVIVPGEMLAGSTTAHVQIKQALVDQLSLDAVITMPAGIFNPHASIATALLLYSKNNSDAAGKTWFYSIESDGFSFDENRVSLFKGDPDTKTFPDDYGDYKEILNTWKNRVGTQSFKTSSRSFLISAEEIRKHQYNLDPRTYQQQVLQQIKNETPVVAAPVKSRKPEQITHSFQEPESNYLPYPETSGRRGATAVVMILLLLCAAAFGYYYYVEKSSTVVPSINDAGLQTANATKSDSIKINKTDASGSKREVAVTDKNNSVEEPILKPELPKPVAKKEDTKVEEEEEPTPRKLGRYKVITKAYFHNQPNETTRRDAFVIHWNNAYATLEALDDKNGFVYVVFTNSEGQTSKGWLKKDDLRVADEND